MSRLLMVTIAVVGLALAACGGDDGGGEAGSGEEVFAGTCAGCHAEDGTGIEGSGKDLTTSEFVASTSADDLAVFVTGGRPASDPDNETGIDMPAKGGNPALTSEDITAVSEYIKTL